MAILFVVDLQREFVKDEQGMTVYKRCLDFIRICSIQYTDIIAGVYKNDKNRNMNMLVRWDEMQKIKKLDFQPTKMAVHSGYSCADQIKVPNTTRIDVIGFDTDACVLSNCFDLFNAGYNFRILADGCWSSGGQAMHEHGLAVMKRQFNRALDTSTSLSQMIDAQRILSGGLGG